MKKTGKKLLTLLLALVMVLGMLAVPALADPEPAITLEDGTYRLPGMTSSLGMFNHFITDSILLAVSGDTATLRFITDGSSSVQKYSKLVLGKSSELLTENYQAEISSGLTVYEGVLQPKAADTDPDKYLFEIPLTKSDAETLLSDGAPEDLYITLWNKSGASSNNYVAGWYKPSSDAYLSLGTLGAKVTALGLDNKLNMFKAVSASLETLDGQTTLVVALSGTGYHELFKGTYEQAVTNGDNTDNWIHGAVNAAGKWEFRIPVAAGETIIPLVAISDSYYTKFLNGEINTLARAFYPRMLELDASAGTLTVMDFQSAQTLSVTNTTSMFKTKATSELVTVGGPNSNDYKTTLRLFMDSTSLSKAFVGYSSSITDTSVTYDLTADQVFEIPVRWIGTAGQPETITNLMENPIVLSFYSAKNQTWSSVRQITISEADGTLVVANVPADYSAVDAAIANVPADLSVYTDESVSVLQTALDAVDRTLTSTQQSQVDTMAQNIADAIQALAPKSGSGDSGSGSVTPASDFDNSTDLPDGTYTISADDYVFTNTKHEVPKSKLVCETVTVTNGKAVGTFSVSSEKMTHVYLDNTESSAEDTALFDSSTGTMGANVYAISDQKVTIPVKLNAETPIAARTTAMSDPSWVNYLYTITVTADEPAEPQTITALVTISDKGELVTGTDGTVVAVVPVLVTDLDGSGDINIDEVMVAAHEEFYNGGAAAGYASSVGRYGLGMDKLWGDESYNFMYCVDNVFSNGLADLVDEGSHVQTWVMKSYSDSFSYFDKLTADAADGSVTLTLSSISYDAEWNPILAPYAGAAITVDGEATSFVTDSEGKVTVSFDKSGTFLISAVGQGEDSLVPPVCLVTATVTEPLTITALVTISDKGELVTGTDGTVVAVVPVLVTDLDGSGDINIDEVMVAAHEEFYPGGAAVGYASSVGRYGLGMDKLWGDESYNFMYCVDNVFSNGLADLVDEGSHVQTWVMKSYSDSFSYFDKLTADAADGSVTLTLSSISYDAEWNPILAPYAGATITIDGEATGFVTDSEGKATVSFDKSGTFLISAVGQGEDSLVPPVCLVTVTLPEGEKDRLDLEITNNTSMFKAVTAYIETGDGASELVMALSGTGYHELFKGTYEKAVANGDNTAAWIHGYENSDGKWEFRIPLTEGESYIPLIAISNSYYTKYLAGENELERAFFARELVIDWDAGTLETGDYSGETITVSVSSSVETFQVAGSTQLTVVGGPNSNNFSVSFSLKMLDEAFDQLTYPTVVGSALGTQTAELSDGVFEIEIVNAPKKTAFENGVPFDVTLRDAETGETLPILVTIDVLAKTIDIEPGDEEANAGTGSTDGTTPAEETAEAVTANVDVTAETEDGKATAAVDAEAVAAALEEEAEAEVLSVKVESKDADTVELTLDAEALKAVAEGGTALSVETEQGTVTLSKDELSKLAEDGGDVAVTLSANEDGSVTLDVTVDGETADVTVKAALPAVEDSQVLVLVKEDGTEEVIRKSLVEDGTAYAYLPAGCTVKAVDNSMDFEDVGDSWYTEYVDFVSSHGLFIGVSETEFAPQANMTRAMLVTVLFRLEDEPEGFTGMKFGDVKDDSWYTDAVAWASETGLVNGTDRGFEPNANISREQIATILYRYVQYVELDTGAKGDVTKFSDGSEVSSWASDAMAWAVGAGLFEGDGTGRLNPKGDATRAEVSALMIRLVKLLVK